MEDYRVVNRANWDERAPAHAASPDYAIERLVAEPDRISDVVAFDRSALGDVSGLRAVHLQCHIGTDTVSLARLGARMSGLDFSPASLAEARTLAERLGLDVDFHEADVYDAVDVLGAERFDLVYTGIGAVGWLPSIDRWAATVAGLLKPGGRLFMREGHPSLFTIDEGREDGLLVVRYPYFESEEPQVWDEPGTYVQTDVELRHTVTHEWNHGIGELLTALLDHGLRITSFVEHDSVPWEALPGAMTLDDRGEWSLTEGRDRLPLSYTVQAEQAG